MPIDCHHLPHSERCRIQILLKRDLSKWKLAREPIRGRVDARTADFYFATPCHSRERGLNEPANSLVRRYFPKGTDFHQATNAGVRKVRERLDNRPRQMPGHMLHFGVEAGIYGSRARLR